MKLPEEVRASLLRRFQSKHREWLTGDTVNLWPLEISLGIPTERSALKQVEGVRAWVAAWQAWRGMGSLSWVERRWQSLGVQRLPEKLILQGPEAVAGWISEAERWNLAVVRHQALAARWPQLNPHLSRHFGVLADYSDLDFQRLFSLLGWICGNPASNLYPRQLPIAGLDSKWLERRKALVADLMATIQADTGRTLGFHDRCGLKAPPQLVRMRILDKTLRACVGGLSDVSAPVEDLVVINMLPSVVFIVENLQTALAMPDIPGAVVIMALGYHVDVLNRLPWVSSARCVYWGDLDTHGFAILNRTRTYLPEVQSVLMDEETLLRHEPLWVCEQQQHHAADLELLTDCERALYLALKQQHWGQNIRLEQERVCWTDVCNVLARVSSSANNNGHNR